MAKKNYNERNRRSVVDIIKSGKIIDNLAAVLDGTYLGIDNRLKEIVEGVADGDDATKRAAFRSWQRSRIIANSKNATRTSSPSSLVSTHRLARPHMRSSSRAS